MTARLFIFAALCVLGFAVASSARADSALANFGEPRSLPAARAPARIHAASGARTTPAARASRDFLATPTRAAVRPAPSKFELAFHSIESLPLMPIVSSQTRGLLLRGSF